MFFDIMLFTKFFLEGEKISIKRMAMVLSIALALLFVMGSASAANETDVTTDDADILGAVSDDAPLGDVHQSVMANSSTQIKTAIKSNDTNIIKDNDFTVQLTDESGAGIADKSVQFTLNKVVTNQTTDANGFARLKVNVNPGSYAVKYSFASDGYASCENSTDILVISTSASKINAPAYTAYVGITNKYTVTLKAGDIPLANREVVFKINGKTYSERTNSKGQATININEAKGSYVLSYFYAGEKNINPVSGSVKIAVKKGVPTKISKVSSKIFRNKKTGYFQIKLVNAHGNPLKSKKVTFKLNGKKYTKKTNSKGIATLKIKLKTGTYKIKVSFAKTSTYNKASKTFTINVKPAHISNNGMWLFGRDMKKVNFTKLQSNGFKHVFLNFKALELHGKSYVESWIKTAKTYGIKVHLWMQVFYSSSGWKNPVSGGKINMKLINSKVKEAKKYAKIKGISGVHFDYIRYPGNAHKFKNSVKAVNTFVKKASKAVHKINKKLIVSAAIMPEPSSMKKYYGQDIPTMSKYLDVLIPMVYKGNYHAGANWIKSVTKTFVKQSKKAKVWTGLQSYRSDSKLTKIPAKELMNDANAALYGGAKGVILFRYELFKFINFNNL